MLERIKPTGSQLATIDPTGGTTAPAEIAAGSVVHMSGGDVAADFRSTGTRDRAREATYELIVSNETSGPLATFTYAVEGAGTEKPITWNAIVVPPHSAIAVEIAIPIPRRSCMPRVVAELFSDETHLTLDAPPYNHIRGHARRFALVVSAAFVIALGAVSVAQTRPRVLALAAPESVRAGTPFSVAYAFSNDDAGRYVVETPDGNQIRGGTLTAKTGAFALDLPKATSASGYDVRVWAGGRFGGDERTVHVVALPPQTAPSARPIVRRPTPSAPALRLEALALDRDIVASGQSIVVSYRPLDDPGVVRLIDALGTVRAEALLTRRGQTIIVAPHVDADQDFRIVATAERGTEHAEAQVAVTVRHGASPTSLDPLGANADAAAAVRTPKSNAPIAVDREQILDRPVVVRIDRYVRDLHVSLMGNSTDEITGVDVAPGEPSVTLTPPTKPATGRYAIVATYTSSLGQETLVRPIAFRAP